MRRNPADKKAADAIGIWKYKSGKRYPPDQFKYHIHLYLHAMRIECDERCQKLRQQVNGPHGDMWVGQLRYWECALTYIETRMKQGLQSVNDRLYQLASIALADHTSAQHQVKDDTNGLSDTTDN